jgi:hypothetical protein
MNRRSLLAMAIVALLFPACDSSSPTTAGTLTAVLVSPNGEEGAAVLDVSGTVESISAANGVSLHTTPVATGTRVIVVRLTPGELSLKVTVPDVSRPPGVTVVEVADGDDKLRQSLAGYRVEFR